MWEMVEGMLSPVKKSRLNIKIKSAAEAIMVTSRRRPRSSRDIVLRGPLLPRSKPKSPVYTVE
jgi:hypothetical protein